VLVVGGSDDVPEDIAVAEIYDPEAETWTRVAPMSTPRIDHTATLLPSGEVLVAGGYSGSSMLASAEVFDPGSGTWSLTPR
jgi:hypothetical protein